MVKEEAKEERRRGREEEERVEDKASSHLVATPGHPLHQHFHFLEAKLGSRWEFQK